MKAGKFLSVIIFLLLFTCLAGAQDIIINGKEDDRLLVWDDFAGRPDTDSPYDAYTYWFVRYRYSNVRVIGDKVVMDFKITVELTQNSWVKKNRQTDRLLQHEQGHFNIARLCGAETGRRMRADTFMVAGYRERIKELFGEILNKYKDMEKRYDEETDHSKNRLQQKKWDAFFETELARYKNAVAANEE